MSKSLDVMLREALESDPVVVSNELALELLRWLFRMVRWAGCPEADQEDLAQDLVEHVLRSLPGASGVSRPYAWLGRVLRNRLIDVSRNRRRLGWLLLEGVIGDAADEDYADARASSPEAACELRCAVEALEDYVARAGTRGHRIEALVRARVLGQTAREIADDFVRTGTAPGANSETVWVWIRRVPDFIEAMAANDDDERRADIMRCIARAA
jgi:DNA-directed RNA polymerase specialized sigma24 family protein